MEQKVKRITFIAAVMLNVAQEGRTDTSRLWSKEYLQANYGYNIPMFAYSKGNVKTTARTWGLILLLSWNTGVKVDGVISAEYYTKIPR